MTVNGVGTHYYGKKNVLVRPAVCPHCKRQTKLTSYDTRLWFVVVFIPIIPLKRMRILDQCASCRRHYAIEMDKWETAKQLEISGALEKYRANPTPEGAIEVHALLMKFHQTKEAETFRQQMETQFRDHANVQAYLGGTYNFLGKPKEGLPYYEKALALRPELPEARVGVAQGRIQAGRLDEARKLLDYLEKPGAGQLYSLVPLENLADAFQKAKRYREALDLRQRLIEEIPTAGQHRAFRKKVVQCEKKLGLRTSILPKAKFSWRSLVPGRSNTWLVIGIVAVSIVIGFMVRNEYVRRHRTVYIVSTIPGKVTVELKNAGSITTKGGVNSLEVKEGRYHAHITGALEEEVDFEVSSGYWDRFSTPPAWVLNPGGGAILSEETAVYSNDPQPPSYAYHFGKSFEYFPVVTNPFQDLPSSIEVDSGQSKTLTGLSDISSKAGQLIYHFYKKRQFDEALRLCESWLRWHPDEEDVLQDYGTLAQNLKQTKRSAAFLLAGLEKRPVRIEWHRYYQTLPASLQEPGLIGKYDRWLAADPTNSALLYLRGRLETSLEAKQRYFERAQAADARNPYPISSLGYESLSAGDFAKARALISQAVKLKPGSDLFERNLYECRFAMGEWKDLEKEFRQKTHDDALILVENLRLVDVLLVQKLTNEASSIVAAYQKASVKAQEISEEAKILRLHWLYVAGHFDELEKAATLDAKETNALFSALIEQGRVPEAAKLLPFDQAAGDDPMHPLIGTVAWQLAGDANQSRQCREHAIRLLKASPEVDMQKCATILVGDNPPGEAELKDLGFSASQRTLLLTVLSQQFPAKAHEYAEAARRLNFNLAFPHHLIERATALP